MKLHNQNNLVLIGGHSKYYVRVFWIFLNAPTPYVRTFSVHKVRENYHFLNPSPLYPYVNIKMVPLRVGIWGHIELSKSEYDCSYWFIFYCILFYMVALAVCGSVWMYWLYLVVSLCICLLV